MKAVVQRVASAEVQANAETVAAIGQGLLALVGIQASDSERECSWMAQKLLNLRIFDDEERKLNRSVMDVGGELLLVSNFTVCGDARHGRRPEFTDAADFDEGKTLFKNLVAEAQQIYPRTLAGAYGRLMRVSLVNDGPVTLVVASP
ncbi:MAG: D-tyrosyl-tRNA(Tyr) deacylase [Armatimonadota bacterium]